MHECYLLSFGARLCAPLVTGGARYDHSALEAFLCQAGRQNIHPVRLTTSPAVAFFGGTARIHPNHAGLCEQPAKPLKRPTDLRLEATGLEAMRAAERRQEIVK